jgi:hypothetical protein
VKYLICLAALLAGCVDQQRAARAAAASETVHQYRVLSNPDVRVYITVIPDTVNRNVCYVLEGGSMSCLPVHPPAEAPR